MNYGFDEDLVEIEPEAYMLGALPIDPIQESGQWGDFLPTYEPQARLYETWGCTVWGGQNQIETYLKRVFGVDANYDERFNYILAGVTVGGANPQVAYESFRKDGLKYDEAMPSTYELFIDKSYITGSRKVEAKKWFDQYTLKHEWLTNPTKETIKEYLKYSPIAISVTAWYQDKNKYIDKGLKNNHWCLCYGYIEDENGITLKVFDSYDQSHKLLDPNHRISFAKRVWIYKTPLKNESWLLKLIKYILSLFS